MQNETKKRKNRHKKKEKAEKKKKRKNENKKPSQLLGEEGKQQKITSKEGIWEQKNIHLTNTRIQENIIKNGR